MKIFTTFEINLASGFGCSASVSPIAKGAERYSTLMKYRKNILVTIVIASFGLIVFKACSNDIDFDSKKWKNWSELNEKDWNLRWDMTDDLIDNHLKKECQYVK